MIAKLQNIILPVKDMAVAERFYGEGLGLELRFRDTEKWTQMKAGSSNVALAAPVETPSGAVGPTPVFEVEDLDGTLARLQLLGAQVVQVRDMASHGRTAALRDPDGNLVQLFQRPPQE
jgi:predicted enzyme related to lactoylglutathione lyase